MLSQYRQVWCMLATGLLPLWTCFGLRLELQRSLPTRSILWLLSISSSSYSPILNVLAVRERFDPESSSAPYISNCIFAYSIFNATYVTDFLWIHSRNKVVTVGLLCFNWQFPFPYVSVIITWTATLLLGLMIIYQVYTKGSGLLHLTVIKIQSISNVLFRLYFSRFIQSALALFRHLVSFFWIVIFLFRSHPRNRLELNTVYWEKKKKSHLDYWKQLLSSWD